MCIQVQGMGSSRGSSCNPQASDSGVTMKWTSPRDSPHVHGLTVSGHAFRVRGFVFGGPKP